MSYLLLIFFCLLPFGAFFFRSVDIWHGQGQFVQIGILILFCYSFFEKPKNIQVLNKPLGSFVCWAGLVTGYWWIKIFSNTQHYPVKIFMPFFNLLCIVLLYKILIEYLNKELIEKILKWLKYSVVLILLYSVIQYLKIDEFYKSVDKANPIKINELVGIMGNRGHSSALLAICQPLFFSKNRENILALILLWLILLTASSASALITGLLIVLFWLLINKKYNWLWAGIVSSSSLLIILFLKYSSFFANNGRFEVWGKAFEIFKGRAITGTGLGYFGALQIQLGNTVQKFQHLHNEWFQVALELGLVGLALAFWVVWDYFKTFKTIKTDLTIKLSSMFLGFCILCFFSFPAHLWVISTLAMFLFSSIYCLKNEELNKCIPA
jgi:O-antigen ligase